jgi:hypothetical protein
MTRITLILATLGLTSLVASPAMANKTDVDLCEEREVKACSRLIDGGKLVDKNLVIWLVFRSEGLERAGTVDDNPDDSRPPAPNMRPARHQRCIRGS